ncbi:MAG: family 16 glycosylhydrolase [Bacteroidota bacterium]
MHCQSFTYFTHIVMKQSYQFLLFFVLVCPLLGFSQVNEAYDDFEGNSNISTWVGDDCGANPGAANPYMQGDNTSARVLEYHDTGGQYANVRFEMSNNFDLSKNQTFSLQIYVPSNGISGNQNNQVSLKLQNGGLPEPWSTQSEIIKPIRLDEWQTVTFDFENDDFRNLDAGSLPPTLRTDFNRVVIQVNGENNNDQVLAYLDNIQLFEIKNNDPVFDELVWWDEFNTNGPIDSEKWHFQTRIPQGDSWFNGEIQHYTNRTENTYIENGVLKIVAKKETFTDQGVTKQYTSARLNSKFAFTYGRVEIRAKLPTGVGTWPAMWMLGKNITEPGAYWSNQGFGTTGWPACGEIDIMEHWGDNQDYISSAMHTPSSHGATVNVGGRVLPNASTEFHIYSLIWTEEKMEFSVDGITHYTYNPTVKNDDTWPFYRDQYFLFNVAILPIIASNFTESALEVDYIRVYQQGESTSTGEIDESSKMIYPNPFDHNLHIATGQTTQASASVKLYNANGLLVREGEATIIDGDFTIENLEALPVGVYILQYAIGNDSYSHRVMKQ